jgi:hypothetical protein
VTYGPDLITVARAPQATLAANSHVRAVLHPHPHLSWNPIRPPRRVGSLVDQGANWAPPPIGPPTDEMWGSVSCSGGRAATMDPKGLRVHCSAHQKETAVHRPYPKEDPCRLSSSIGP